MDAWREKARQLVPELGEFQTAPHDQSGLGTELYLWLLRAYDPQPIDDDLIGRIYTLAGWCVDQHDDNLSSEVAIGFVESLPLDKRVTEDLYRWMSLDTFKGFENLLRYHLTTEEFENFARDFANKKRTFGGESHI